MDHELVLTVIADDRPGIDAGVHPIRAIGGLRRGLASAVETVFIEQDRAPEAVAAAEGTTSRATVPRSPGRGPRPRAGAPSR